MEVGGRHAPFSSPSEIHQITAQLLNSRRIPTFVLFSLVVSVLERFDLNLAQIWHKDFSEFNGQTHVQLDG